MTTGTEWQVGSDTRVIVHPQDECDPPRLFMADASNSLTLVPPTDREKVAEFTAFLADLADAAHELAVMCLKQTPSTALDDVMHGSKVGVLDPFANRSRGLK
ncbi:hypothetical protein [Kibdelosporangium phytohabitans]|uniref:Uncharacterized protein n=1 Tax=Kibdelosporangium phytohabitans TaxID=860235 RepID=A0A0N9HYQ7_9PSEU|nr:hypothetical protein [Kibdelosporangium phytohabitans]ALG07448.1 hypothetical protein AOZ06_11430 [Kibdelosporangium phytohabitans]MBE1471651.1 hypothetical protein [Kibdelosporangium phytohabitans]